MGYITINTVTFSPPAVGQQHITIRHRLTADPDIAGSYTLDSSDVLVNANGTLVTPFTINNLLENTSYTIKCNNNCSASSFQQIVVVGTTTSTSSTTSTTSQPPFTVHVTSTLGGTSLTSVTGVSGFSLSQSLEPGEVQNGHHNVFTGTISMTLNGPPVVNGNALLEVNNTIIQCINILTSDSFPKTVIFSSRTYSSSDFIDLQLNTGLCV